MAAGDHALGRSDNRTPSIGEGVVTFSGGTGLMIGRTRKDRRGVTLIELLVVVLIVSILAAIAQPQLTSVIVKARAADAISDMQVVRVALYNYQSDQQAWPPDVNRGIVPPGLDAYLPAGFDFEKEDYTL